VKPRANSVLLGPTFVLLVGWMNVAGVVNFCKLYLPYKLL